MRRLFVLCFAVCSLWMATFATAQPCPKVSYTTETATLRKLITTVNCLVARGNEGAPSATPESSTGVQVDTLRIIGPQHRGPYRKIIVVILSVPVGDSLKTVLATPDNPEANATATAGATCRAKINSDNTVDGQCNLTGGTIYVVYHN
ncbi:MAG TPA: hypothetical protein VJQ82_08085 [Terriglobales bacterium]|nr:hypothetical protein [Terriglobales bacterium]